MIIWALIVIMNQFCVFIIFKKVEFEKFHIVARVTSVDMRPKGNSNILTHQGATKLIFGVLKSNIDQELVL